MHELREMSENGGMRGIAVALLSEDRERLSRLQDRLRATSLGREVFSHIGFPVSATDTIMHRLQDSRAEVVIIDVPSQNAQRAICAIALIRDAAHHIAIFASGDMTQPANIVASMRNGASEYLDQSSGYEVLLEALTRLSSSRTRALGAARKAQVFTFVSAKGGAGCTTAAVNTALALQKSRGEADSIGHARARCCRAATVNSSLSVVHSARKSFHSFQEEKHNGAASDGCVCGRHGMRSCIDIGNWTTGIANSAADHGR
jgi:DNA-binding NarL/FixJ family response regulator